MREKLIELLEEARELPCTGSLDGFADYLISHGVTVREKGEWKFPTVYLGITLRETCHCSVCNEIPIDISGKANYCPNCGADMRGEQT